MNERAIHVFNHHAMATQFQVRIADCEENYAEQAAQTAFGQLDELELRLSRFLENSEISQIALLVPGETLRLSQPTFACLEIAHRMETDTRGAFSVSAAALKTQPVPPRWSLVPNTFLIRCDCGRLDFDLGAIGKGFALDRMAEILREWGCNTFLLVAGGSSVLAGDAPAKSNGWSCGLGDDNSTKRFWLKNCSLSGSGLAAKGKHILDPRTGKPARRLNRAWALADTGAESDALSTAAMVLTERELTEMVFSNKSWLLFFSDASGLIHIGIRPLPNRAC